MSNNLLTAQDLRALKRPVVQRIAKVCTVPSCHGLLSHSVVVTDHRRVQREGVRANGKTEDIITALLDACPNGVEP